MVALSMIGSFDPTPESPGFHALVNYHRLADGQQGYKLLETLAFTYLGDWIRQLETAQGSYGTAEARLIHARTLQENLHRILDGQSPHDIFVRWKPLEAQPIGWLWTKDRGKDVESAPWYNLGPECDGNPGDRINDHHLTQEEKQEARET